MEKENEITQLRTLSHVLIRVVVGRVGFLFWAAAYCVF